MPPWTADESKEIYRTRIERAAAYIQANLGDAINLEKVAGVAAFSPFHFHRIFSALMGETPKGYVNRLRLEKAANVLLKNRAMSITEAALLCGFSSPAVFARVFKQYYGFSASQCREEGIFAVAKEDERIDAMQNMQRGARFLKDVQVCTLPDRKVAYIPNLEGYSLEKICPAWEKLYLWAEAQGWINSQTRMIGISFDDPFITPKEKCRYYACITVPDDAPTPKKIGTMALAGGPYAVCHAVCAPEEFVEIYQALYGLWLPESGFQPADQPTYEVYVRTPEVHPEGKFELEVCLPLE